MPIKILIAHQSAIPHYRVDFFNQLQDNINNKSNMRKALVLCLLSVVSAILKVENPQSLLDKFMDTNGTIESAYA